jgi:hypothetical protein
MGDADTCDLSDIRRLVGSLVRGECDMASGTHPKGRFQLRLNNLFVFAQSHPLRSAGS